MTLRFVKTSVLVSEDGLDFSKETAVETEETRSARLARESAANKPLYQQLAEQKQKKQEEYDANTKLMFSAPKALDDEEYHFLESLHDAQEQAERFQKQEEEKALEAFRAARKVESSDNSATGKSTHAAVVLRVEQSSKPSLSLGTKITAIKGRFKFTILSIYSPYISFSDQLPQRSERFPTVTPKKRMTQRNRRSTQRYLKAPQMQR
jgi:hypothetical protein